MREGWKRVKLGEVCSLVTKGATPRSWGKQSDGIVFVKAENIVDGFLRCEHPNYISRDVHENELKRSRLQSGDLLITIAGAIGRIAIVNDDVLPANINQAVATVRVASHDVDVKYVYYYLRQPAVTLWLSALSAGQSVQANLNLKQVSEISLPLPPLATQRKIAAVLGALDDKIELNRRMNANLEAQAQALFKSWFVDFEPWGGKMPSGWRKTLLSEVAEFYPGYSYTSAELKPSRVAMATIKNFERGGGFKLDGFKEIVPSAKLKDTQCVEVFDTVVAHTDMTQNADIVGNAEMVLSDGGYDKLIASTDLVRVLPKNGISKFLVAALLKNPVFKAHCLGYVNGTTVLHMKKSALSEYSMMLPSDMTTLDGFANRFEAIYMMIAKNINESRKLAELRDALLPKLMSGELEVEGVA